MIGVRCTEVFVSVLGSNVAFGNELNSRLRDIFCEFIALCQACLEGGIPAIEALIQHCVVSFT
jgi:hypothetical protein